MSTPAGPRGGGVTLVFAVTVFASAFLLFLVQPLMGRYILPWFGSALGVWAACLLFFQLVLVAGYAYAHLLVGHLRPQRQALVHGVLVLLALATLPITPALADRPASGGSPLWQVLQVLALSVGLPYLVVSASAPLLQAWFSRVRQGPGSPYRLYALSNVGALLALWSYPFLVEWTLPLRAQTIGWSLGFGLLAGLLMLCAWILVRRDRGPDAGSEGRASTPQAPGWLTMAHWLLLAAAGSALLLATTNQLCLDVAAVPFLWVLPLSLYLLTYILSFASPRWYPRPLWCGILALMLGEAVRLLHGSIHLGLAEQLVGYSAVLVAGCMCCHGELARRTPHPRHLTRFFLLVAVGGAIGGLCVAGLAPWLLRGLYEYHLTLVACYVLGIGSAVGSLLRHREVRGSVRDARGRAAVLGAAVVGLLLLVGSLAWLWQAGQRRAIEQDRNFHGTLAIKEYQVGLWSHRLSLFHGRIRHGAQYLQHPGWPTTYYGPESGAGLAIQRHPRRQEAGRQFRVGVVGLGVGTLAAYANAWIDPAWPDPEYVTPQAWEPPDHVCFYELNPMVVDWAERHFTFLRDARRRGAEVLVRPGDARIVMERQLAQGQPQRFDVLILDAFTSDAIPVHLLTLESLEVYQAHLAQEGILAIHVSNRFLDLVPVCQRLALELGLEPRCLVNDRDLDRGVSRSRWVLLTRNRRFLEAAMLPADPLDLPPPGPLWTDDFSSILPLIRR